jgi:hypothetical protein
MRDPLLQGAGALGAYQAGYEALTGAGIHADWIADISIGAINAAIIPLQWVAVSRSIIGTLVASFREPCSK